VYNGI
jgi:hypothetical protein